MVQLAVTHRGKQCFPMLAAQIQPDGIAVQQISPNNNKEVRNMFLNRYPVDVS